MKKINLTIAILTTLASLNLANAETTVTTTQYTQKIDESSVSKLVPLDKKSDRDIQKSLDTRINSYPDLRDNVSFIVQDGIIILKGNVEKASQKDYAAMMAAAIPGVVRVDNLISIK